MHNFLKRANFVLDEAEKIDLNVQTSLKMVASALPPVMTKRKSKYESKRSLLEARAAE